MKYSEQEYNLWNRDVTMTNRHQAFYEARVSGMTPEQQRDHMYMFTKKKEGEESFPIPPEGRHYFKHIDTREYISFPIPPEGEDVVIEDGEVLRGYETRMGSFEFKDEFAEASPEVRNAMYRLMREREMQCGE